MDIASCYKFVDEQIVTTGLDNATLIEKVCHGVTVPVEVNYLLGKKRSHLELGVGMSNGLYRWAF